MSNFMDVIKGRRSIRHFQDKAIPEEVLNQVLEAARWAQSWANTQCWEIVVIRDQAIKEALQKTSPEGNPSHTALVSAPVVLALCGKLESSGFYKGATATKLGDWFLFDLGIATQNIALEAHALGLGSVVLGLFDQEAAKKILNVPEGCELATLMPLGYPAQEGTTPPRKELETFVHQDTF